MTDKDKATYDALIEAAARIVAFEGVSDRLCLGFPILWQVKPSTCRWLAGLLGR